jgi:transcriptional regulator GlxA family with amidase domain
MSPDTIAVIAFDGISPFHLSVPSLVFGEDRTSLGVPRYKMMVCAEGKKKIPTTGGFVIEAPYALSDLREAGTVIVPSWRNPEERPSPRLLDAIRSAHEGGAKIVGLCLGAFVLAEAGILDGRRATTHWNWAGLFSRRYPQVALNADVLYIDEGDVMTSAGTAAGIDCCLHLLRTRLGAEITNRVARRLVVAPHRPGGQAQYIEQPLATDSGADRLSSALIWATAHLQDDLNVDLLAQKALMSRRTFTRRFRQSTGATVVKWLTHQRVAAAQRLLETTDLPIGQVAASAGFGSALLMRQYFGKMLRVSPTAYREEFRGSGS